MKFRVLLVAAAVFFSEVLSIAQSTRPVATAIQPQIAFEENHGQVDPQVRYLGHAGKSTVFLTPEEAVIATPPASSAKHQAASVLRLKWIGANPRPEASVENKLGGKVNYLIGADPKRWQTNLPTYGRVRYHNLFAGTDAVFYGKDGQLEYDLVVAPGSDPHNIRFAFEGQQTSPRRRARSRGRLKRLPFQDFPTTPLETMLS